MEDYIKIGYTKKTFGVGGGLKTHIEPRFIEAFLKTEVVFLKINKRPTPFFIEGIEEVNEIILFFEDVNSKEEAIPFCAKEIMLQSADLESVTIEAKELPVDGHQYVDFQIEAKGIGVIGIIEEIVDLPEQLIAIVMYENKEVLIPLNEQFIKEVDQNKQKLKMELPEGLLDL